MRNYLEEFMNQFGVKDRDRARNSGLYITWLEAGLKLAHQALEKESVREIILTQLSNKKCSLKICGEETGKVDRETIKGVIEDDFDEIAHNVVEELELRK